MTRRLILTGAFITICLGVAGVYLSSSPANARIPYTDVSQIADGQRVHQQYCASCHGANLEGESCDCEIDIEVVRKSVK